MWQYRPILVMDVIGSGYAALPRTLRKSPFRNSVLGSMSVGLGGGSIGVKVALETVLYQNGIVSKLWHPPPPPRPAPVASLEMVEK